MVLLAQLPKRNRPPKAEVEIFMIRSCLGEIVGTEGMQHLELGRQVKVTEDMARQLTRWAGSAYFVHGEDDDTTDKHYTLTPERRAPAECEQRMRQQMVAKRKEEEAFVQASRRALIEKYGVL